MKRRLIIHVGMPKAASTSIQRFLEHHRAHLSHKAGVFYPDTAGLAKHRDAFAQLSARDEEIECIEFYRAHFWYRRYLRDNAIERNAFPRLMEEILKSALDTVVCSTEELWEPNTFNQPALQRIQMECSQLNREIKIVGVLRDQWSWLTSHYSTLIRSGRHPALPKGPTYTFDQFLWRNWVSGTVDYKRRLQTFADVFGKENVRIMWLEGVAKDQVISSFLELCEIPPLEFHLKTDPQNQRPSWSAIRAMRWTNRLQIGRVLTSRAILRADEGLHRIFGKSYMNWRPPFDEAMARQIREMFAADNAVLTDEYGFRSKQ